MDRSSIDLVSLVVNLRRVLGLLRAVACVSTAVCLWSWLDAGWVYISVLLCGVDCGVHGGVNRE